MNFLSNPTVPPLLRLVHSAKELDCKEQQKSVLFVFDVNNLSSVMVAGVRRMSWI